MLIEVKETNYWRDLDLNRRRVLKEVFKKFLLGV
jgi:hypothetical protein